MRVICDKKNGAIYTTVMHNEDVNLEVLDVDLPQGKVLSRIEVKNGELNPVLIDMSSVDPVSMQEQITELQLAIAELSNIESK